MVRKLYIIENIIHHVSNITYDMLHINFNKSIIIYIILYTNHSYLCPLSNSILFNIYIYCIL